MIGVDNALPDDVRDAVTANVESTGPVGPWSQGFGALTPRSTHRSRRSSARSARGEPRDGLSRGRLDRRARRARYARAGRAPASCTRRAIARALALLAVRLRGRSRSRRCRRAIESVLVQPRGVVAANGRAGRDGDRCVIGGRCMRFAAAHKSDDVLARRVRVHRDDRRRRRVAADRARRMRSGSSARGGGSRRCVKFERWSWVWTRRVAVRARLQRAHRDRDRRLSRRRRAIPGVARRREVVQPARRARLAADLSAVVPDARRGLGARSRPDVRPVLPRLRDRRDVGAHAVPPAPRDGRQPARQARAPIARRSASRSGGSSTRKRIVGGAVLRRHRRAVARRVPRLGDRVPRVAARRLRVLSQRPRRPRVRRLLRQREARRSRRAQGRRHRRDARRGRPDDRRPRRARDPLARRRVRSVRAAARGRAIARGARTRSTSIDSPRSGVERHTLNWSRREPSDARRDRARRRHARTCGSSHSTPTCCSARRTAARVRARAGRCGRASAATCRTTSSALEHGGTIHYTVWSQLDAAAGPTCCARRPARCRAATQVYLQLPLDEITRAHDRARAPDHRRPAERLRQGDRDPATGSTRT